MSAVYTLSQATNKDGQGHTEVSEVELNAQTAREKADCYYNLHRNCDKDLTMLSHSLCKSCMVEAYSNIVRLKRNGVAREPTYEGTLKRWKR